jgi:hypothetical protein
LYDAETDVFSVKQRFLYPLVTKNGVMELVTQVVSSSWWRGPEDVELVHHVGGRWAMANRHSSTTGELLLPRWAWNRPTVLHELCHLQTWGRQHHGPAFAGSLLQAHELFGAVEDARALAEAFDEYGVRYLHP